MEIIKSNLEKVFKEYTEYKDTLQTLMKKMEVNKDNFATTILNIEDEDAQNEYFYEEKGWLSSANNDLAQLKMRMYFTYEAYKDIINIPEELKVRIEEELKDVSPRYVFSLKNGEKEIIDKELFNQHKEQFKLYQQQLKKFNGGA